MNLTEPKELQAACEKALANVRKSREFERWSRDLQGFLHYVREADRSTRITEQFHERIWDENPIASAGQGNISVTPAIQDFEFRTWVAEQSFIELPETGEARIAVLQQVYEETLDRIRAFTSKLPRLKIFRVLGAFFPQDMTALCDEKKLRELHSAMGLPRPDHVVALHMDVLRQLDQVFGRSGTDLAAIAERMRLPWLLYDQYVAGEKERPKFASRKSESAEQLEPLPAAPRRRGLTGIVGGLDSILNILEFAKSGVNREDLKDHIRTIAPNAKDSTLNTNISCLMAEYGVLKRDGDLYLPTTRGETFLGSGDPERLVDWVLTHVLGPDHVLLWLTKEQSISREALIIRLQRVNPGWTTNFAPGLLLNNLSQLDLITRLDDGNYKLTNAGHRWSVRIHWEPQVLSAKEEEITLDSPAVATKRDLLGTGPSVKLPQISEIVASITEEGHFSDALIFRLHNGLWSHKRRHFAVLTGLSGSGKTLLASAYARAIAGAGQGKRVCVIPVQPGWYDPSALLGYVNPLHTETYVRTEFVEFLLRAVANPDHPHTAVLDEFNLSRPEQYLAPILSAMETPESAIGLHREGDSLDGIPSVLPYPSNLVLVGTVNMDETTHGISDKVLDRAFTIEFWKIDIAKYPKWGKWGLQKEDEELARSLLEALMASLEPARLHFGWRTIDDVLGYLKIAMDSADQFDVQKELDNVIYAKVLPKLRGDDSPSFRKALKTCAAALGEHKLPQSKERVLELDRDLRATGSARFWR